MLAFTKIDVSSTNKVDIEKGYFCFSICDDWSNVDIKECFFVYTCKWFMGVFNRSVTF